MKRFLAVSLIISIVVFPLSAESSVYEQVQNRNTKFLDEIVVTGAREEEPLKERPQNIGVISKKDLEETKAAHPSEIMRKVSGVWVDTTAGEGHKTAIRHPLTTNPVYLYLEDGIPVRSTGFFNHNALYEVNIPGASRIEIIKGPGTVLYGSDAIGGTINVITKPSPASPEVELNAESGSFGWYRLLATGGNTWGNSGLRLGLNNTHTDGWRDRTGYDRQTMTLRSDQALSDTALLKTMASYSTIDQKTSGSNGLALADFKSRPAYNYQTFDFRKVSALRVSSELEKETGRKGLISLIAFVRQNQMDLLPGFGIFRSGNNYFGYNSVTKFSSFGLLAKYRHDFDPMNSRLIVGADIDRSPGAYYEKRINVTRTGDKYTSYTFAPNTNNDYDFEAEFTGISPYLQCEATPVKKLRVTAGVRYDDISYDYETKLAPNANRPANTKPAFSHLSPKAGATYEHSGNLSLFASYANGFRAPSSGDLFRGNSGTAATAINLKPIKVDNYEIGFRGSAGKAVTLDSSAYYMTKADDIVNFSVTQNQTQRLNAGKTEHKGIETSLGFKAARDIDLNVSYSYAIHTYKEYRVSSAIDYSGKEIAIAPRQIADSRIKYSPSFLNGGTAELEWVKIGEYWADDANTEKYEGYDLFNFRVSCNISDNWAISLRAINLADTLYAEEVSKSATGAAQYSPGQPRTVFANINYKWGAASAKKS
ncbi:MAG: TonB-dependent receptor [Elusimicrobia bacterium]|nr:TonB-dependent receptor [Candidatus Liberimonas magnetica]